MRPPEVRGAASRDRPHVQRVQSRRELLRVPGVLTHAGQRHGVRRSAVQLAGCARTRDRLRAQHRAWQVAWQAARSVTSHERRPAWDTGAVRRARRIALYAGALAVLWLAATVATSVACE